MAESREGAYRRGYADAFLVCAFKVTSERLHNQMVDFYYDVLCPWVGRSYTPGTAGQMELPPTFEPSRRKVRA